MISGRKTLSPRQVVAGLFLAICLCGAAVDTAAAQKDEPVALDVDLDIHKFKVTKNVELGGGQRVTIKLDVKNRGMVDEPRPATVDGVQNGVQIYSETMMVSAPLGGEERRFDFRPYIPTQSGNIVWLATIDDDNADVDEATRTTRVEEPKDPPPPPPPPGDGEDNLLALHDRRSDLFEGENCINCHGDVLSRHSQDPTIETAHIAMLPFVPGDEDRDRCVFCHRGVGLVQGTQRLERQTGNIRRYVDVAVCTLCHSPGRDGGSSVQFYEATLFSPSDPDGPYLYDVLCSGCHGVLGDSEVQDEDAEEIQEKIDENEGGMGPLEVLTWDEIVAIADALAASGRNTPAKLKMSSKR